ncbi:MAG TPA: 4-(cytidine 5'-diphospho)-2-C-methyl-D-erythritol kinase [Gemmatimonadaceae bacterium]|jgi:4-diphosphocytidyl-2-C-methyl-D-erythritol kinase
MTRAARVLAQAKINLRLRVLAREASGYHSIETVFQRLDWGDDVTVRVATGRSLDCTGAAMPAEGLGPIEKNLAYRAAAVYTGATGWPSGFAIEIEKRIPVGGGLGGGSSDAGAVLRGLDALSPTPLGSRLVELAAGLGADVPFLSTETPTALAWGRGERMLAVGPLPPRTVVLIGPGFAVGTAEAYGWVAEARGSYAPEPTLLDIAAFNDWTAIEALATNDFERVVAKRHARIAELVDELASFGAAPAMMSGSGSTVFGIFAQPPDVAAIARSTACSPIVTVTSTRVVRVGLDV